MQELIQTHTFTNFEIRLSTTTGDNLKKSHPLDYTETSQASMNFSNCNKIINLRKTWKPYENSYII